MLLDEVRCRRAIAEAFPEIDVRSVRYFAAGWDYELWEVNGELLFRFPLRPECGDRLPAEARLLAALAGSISVAIPQPVFVSEGCRSFPMPFLAYRKLAGVPLEQRMLSEAGRNAVARDIGRFLSELHSVPVDPIAALGVPVRIGTRWRDRYVKLRERSREKIYPLLAEDEARSMDAFWADFLGRRDYFEFTPAVIHCDLDGEHILVGADGATVIGVIDFGDARIGDPALDFAGFEEDLRHAVLQSYALPVDATLGERAEIYRSRISPIYGVLHGLAEGLPDWVDRGLATVRAAIGNAALG